MRREDSKLGWEDYPITPDHLSYLYLILCQTQTCIDMYVYNIIFTGIVFDNMFSEKITQYNII